MSGLQGDNPVVSASPADLPTDNAPRLRKAATLRGQHLLLRNAASDDAAFIWQLRRNAARNAYMSATSAELADQQAWLARYAQDNAQAYFVITQLASGEPLGTVRLYDARGDSFSWGSWLLRTGLPARCAIESALMVYHYARSLGFAGAHFEVRQDNASVWRFHENFGATRVDCRDNRFFYELAPDALTAALQRWRRYLPHGIRLVE